MAWVEPLDRPADGAALPTGVHAFDDDQQPGADLAASGLPAELETECDELLLSGEQPFFVFFLIQSECQIYFVEASHRPRP